MLDLLPFLQQLNPLVAIIIIVLVVAVIHLWRSHKDMVGKVIELQAQTIETNNKLANNIELNTRATEASSTFVRDMHLILISSGLTSKPRRQKKKYE